MFKFTVPGEPQELNCQAVSEYRVLVRWKKPKNPNGVVVQYQLSYHFQRKSISTDFYNTSAHDRMRMIDRLKPYTSYVIVIKAATKVGYGKLAKCDVRTKEGCKYSIARLCRI